MNKSGRKISVSPYGPILFLLTLLVLHSCGIKKRSLEKLDPSLPNLENFNLTDIETDTVSPYETTTALATWWSKYNDPVLDTLIARARRNNFDVNTAVANFYAANAALKSQKFDRFPTVTTSGTFTRQRLGQNVFLSGSNPIFSQYDGMLNAEWEIGLFGRVGNRIKAAKSFEQAQLADLQDVYTVIFGNVARSYMEYRGIQNQILIADRNIESQRDAYRLTKERTEAGTGNSLDEARSLTLYESTRAILPLLEGRLIELENRLSVMIGELPGSLRPLLSEFRELPSLPLSISIGNTEELLQRRPDIFRAESLLAQQMAIYNLNVAELFPRIAFNGNIGFSAIDFSSFGKKEAFTWSIIPSISWAAFNLGRVKKNIDREDGLTLALLNTYQNTVLNALEEVRTSMALYTARVNRRDKLTRAVESGRNAVDLARKRYDAGLDDFLDYLSAQSTQLELENELALTETETALGLINIYSALGSGWEIISPEETQDKYSDLKSNDTSKN